MLVLSLLVHAFAANAACPDPGRVLPADMDYVTPSVLLIERGDGHGSGVLIDPTGRIAGIVSSSLVDESLPNIGLAVPSDVILTWLEDVSLHVADVDFLPNNSDYTHPN